MKEAQRDFDKEIKALKADNFQKHAACHKPKYISLVEARRVKQGK